MKSTNNISSNHQLEQQNNREEELENIKKEKDKKKGVQKVNFQDEIKRILFAFGDSENPNDETIEALEEYLFDFLDKLLTNCGKRMNRRDPNSTRIIKEDVLF